MGGVRSRTKAAPERHQSRTSHAHQSHGRTATRQTVREAQPEAAVGPQQHRSGTASRPHQDGITMEWVMRS